MPTERKEPRRDVPSGPTPGGERPETDYFTCVERRFQQLRGSPILVSPRDWARIASWRERGIPKEAVLGGIEEAFQRKRDREPGSVVRSLAYCEPFVVEAWNRRRTESVARPEAHRAPGGGAWSGESLREHLRRARRVLAEAVEGRGTEAGPLEDCVRSCAARLDREAGAVPSPLPPEWVRDLEGRLIAMEQELAAAARAVLSPEEDGRLQAEVERDLRGYREMMSDATYRETRRVLFEDRVRRFHSLPRLTLFCVP